MDPLSLKLMEFMPLPNAQPADPFTNSLNFISLAVTPVKQGVTTVRVDHCFSECLLCLERP